MPWHASAWVRMQVHGCVCTLSRSAARRRPAAPPLAWMIWRPSTLPAAVCSRYSPGGTASASSMPYTVTGLMYHCREGEGRGGRGGSWAKLERIWRRMRGCARPPPHPHTTIQASTRPSPAPTTIPPPPRHATPASPRPTHRRGGLVSHRIWHGHQVCLPRHNVLLPGTAAALNRGEGGPRHALPHRKLAGAGAVLGHHADACGGAAEQRHGRACFTVEQAVRAPGCSAALWLSGWEARQRSWEEAGAGQAGSC